VLVRHGRGWCNEAGVIGGRRGCRGLSDAGRDESDRLAGLLAAMAAERPFDVLVSSPRLRVRQCAEVIGSRLGLPVLVVDRLAGQEFGAADGRSWELVTSAFGGPPAHDPDRPIAAGAEAWNAYAGRVLAALAQLLAEHAGRRICVVAHGKTSGLAAALLTGAADPRQVPAELVVGHGDLAAWHHDGTAWARITPAVAAL
jgi:probable phosphoglycerate mutase